jgi:hypothetical protein
MRCVLFSMPLLSALSLRLLQGELTMLLPPWPLVVIVLPWISEQRALLCRCRVS